MRGPSRLLIWCLFTSGLVAATPAGAAGPSARGNEGSASIKTLDGAPVNRELAKGYAGARRIATRNGKVVFEACKEGRLFIVVLTQDGDTMAETPIGDCGASRVVTSTARVPPSAPSPAPVQDTRAEKSAETARVVTRAIPPPDAYTKEAAATLQDLREQRERQRLEEERRSRPVEKQVDEHHAEPRSALSVTDKLRRFVRRQGFSHVSIVIGDPPVYIIEGCRANVRWRLAIDRSGHISDRAERGPCFRKVLGLGMDDLLSAVHWLVGCEEPLDEPDFVGRTSLDLGPPAARVEPAVISAQPAKAGRDTDLAPATVVERR